MASTRFDVLQVLRALAALAVVFFHLPSFNVGQFGVDLFFVISGFIMCYVTERGNQGFLRKRIARIVPLYWLCTMAVVCAALVAPSLFGSTRADLGELVRSLLFIPFMKSNGIYPVLFLGWSLNFEMLFYGIMALAMVMSQRHRIELATLMVCVLVVTGMLVQTSFVPVMFYMQPIILEFVLGVAAYVVYSRLSERSLVWSVAWRRVLTGIGIITASMVMIMVDVAVEPLTRPLIWGGCGFVIVTASLLGWRDVEMPRWLVRIGDSSYSLYLLHPYVIQAIVVILRKALIDTGDVNIVTTIVAPVACVGVAIMMYTYVERPLDTRFRRLLLRETPHTAA